MTSQRSERSLVLRGAGVRLGGRHVWQNLNVEIESGEFVAVLGPNGSGKSTLLRAILGQCDGVTGEIEVLGRAAGASNRSIGYLPQRRRFHPDLRIRGEDIVRLGVDGHRWGFSGWGRAAKAARRRVEELIECVDASQYARRPIGECSGGEQQRLLIAQALAQRPRMLLLDEPLDSLDLPNQAGVSALIAQVCREEGVTVLIVAHDVNPLLGYIDRVLYFAGGDAVVGTPDEVINSETLTRLYRSPIEVLQAGDGRLVVVGQPEAPSYHPDLVHPRPSHRHGPASQDSHGHH